MAGDYGRSQTIASVLEDLRNSLRKSGRASRHMTAGIDAAPSTRM